MNYKRMVFLAPEDAGGAGAEPAPEATTELIQEQPREAPVQEFSKPKYFSQVAPAKADSEDYKALYKYQRLDELTDAALALQKENDELRKTSERSIVVPDGKDPEAVREFARKLGVPDTPDGYTMKTLASLGMDAESQKIVREVCHNAMLTDRQAEQFGVAMARLAKRNTEASSAFLENRRKNFQQTLGSTYTNYDTDTDRLIAADKDIAAYKSFAEESGLAKLFDKTGVSLNTEMVKGIAAYVRKHSGQVKVDAVPGGESSSKESSNNNYGSDFMKRYGGR